MSISTTIESGDRIQLPAEWVKELGLRNEVTLEKTPNGILVRPSSLYNWDEIFADKLLTGQAPAETDVKVNMDDYLF